MIFMVRWNVFYLILKSKASAPISGVSFTVFFSIFFFGSIDLLVEFEKSWQYLQMWDLMLFMVWWDVLYLVLKSRAELPISGVSSAGFFGIFFFLSIDLLVELKKSCQHLQIWVLIIFMVRWNIFYLTLKSKAVPPISEVSFT